MGDDAKIDLLARLARGAGKAADPAPKGTSILALAAACYGSSPDEESTRPTGFDPLAVSLFEAIVEGAYLVATADGNFDDTERAAFEQVVVAACNGSVQPGQITALVADLADHLAEDGRARRIEDLAKRVKRVEHAREVLRIAALIARASGDVSDDERTVLGEIGAAVSLGPADVESAIADVKAAFAVFSE